MEERIYNYCPYCGVKILKSHNHQINYCRNCGQKLKLEKYNNHDKVQCVVCHRYIWSGRFDTIECSFCGSKYHTKCVFSWLTKYNSCPLCLNVYLKPSITKLTF